MRLKVAVLPVALKELILKIVLLSVHVLDTSCQFLQRILGISEKHVCVILEENWVVHTCITSCQTSLHDNHLFGIPHPHDRHASNLRVRVVFGSRVHCVEYRQGES
jgi:hypothetical protein